MNAVKPIELSCDVQQIFILVNCVHTMIKSQCELEKYLRGGWGGCLNFTLWTTTAFEFQANPLTKFFDTFESDHNTRRVRRRRNEPMHLGHAFTFRNWMPKCDHHISNFFPNAHRPFGSQIVRFDDIRLGKGFKES